MALNRMGLGFVFTVRDLASPRLRGISSAFVGMDRATNKAGRGATSAMGAMIGGMMVLGGATLGLKSAFDSAAKAGEFEQELAFLGRLTRDDAVGMDELAKSARDAAFSTQFTPTEAILGLRRLKTAGLSATQAMFALGPALDVATFGGISVADAAASVAGSLKAFQIPAEQAGRVADKLAAAVAFTNLQAEEFKTALSQASGAAGLFNQTLTTTLVGIGLLRNRNLQASRAATQLRESIRRVAAQQSSINLLRKLGVKIFDEESGKMGDILKIMVQMEEKMRGMDAAQRNITISTAFGARGLQAYGAALSEQVEVLRDGKIVTLKAGDAIDFLMDKVENSVGLARELRDVRLDTFAGALQLLTGTSEALDQAMGKLFIQTLEPLARFMKEFQEGLSKALEGLPKDVKAATGAVFLFSLAFIGLAGAITLVGGAIALLALIPGVLPMLAVLTAVVAVAGAVGAIIGLGFVGIFRRAGKAANGFTFTLEKVKLFFTGLGEALEGGAFSEDTFKALTEEGNEGVLRFILRINRAFTNMRRFMDQAIEGFDRFFETMGGDEAIKDLMAAVDNLGAVIFGANGILGEFTEGTGKDATTAGERFGLALGKIAVMGIILLTVFTNFLTILLRVFDVLSPVLKLAFALTGIPAFLNIAGGLLDFANVATGIEANAAGVLASGPAGELERGALENRRRLQDPSSVTTFQVGAANVGTTGTGFRQADIDQLVERLGEKYVTALLQADPGNIQLFIDSEEISKRIERKKRSKKSRGGEETDSGEDN